MVLKTIFKISVSFKNAPFIARKRLPLLHWRFVNAKELLSLDTASLFLKVRLRRRRTWSLRANYESTRFEYWRLCRRGLYLNQARWRRRDSPGWEWCAANKRIWWSATIVKQVWLFLEHIFCRNRRHCTVVEPFFSLVVLNIDVKKNLLRPRPAWRLAVREVVAWVDAHARVDKNGVELVLVWHFGVGAVAIDLQLFRVFNVITQLRPHHREALQTNGEDTGCTVHGELFLGICHLATLLAFVLVTLVQSFFTRELLKAVVQIFAILKLSFFTTKFYFFYLYLKRHIEKGLVRVRIVSTGHASDSWSEPPAKDPMRYGCRLLVLV